MVIIWPYAFKMLTIVRFLDPQIHSGLISTHTHTCILSTHTQIHSENNTSVSHVAAFVTKTLHEGFSIHGAGREHQFEVTAFTRSFSLEEIRSRDFHSWKISVCDTHYLRSTVTHTFPAASRPACQPEGQRMAEQDLRLFLSFINEKRLPRVLEAA